MAVFAGTKKVDSATAVALGSSQAIANNVKIEASLNNPGPVMVGPSGSALFRIWPGTTVPFDSNEYANVNAIYICCEEGKTCEVTYHGS